MKPFIGHTVAYKLTESDALQINRRRGDAATHHATRDADGAQIHVGNAVSAGEVYPLLITKVDYVTETELDEATINYVSGADMNGAKVQVVNGQVMLDGNDTLWVTNRFQCYRQVSGQPEPGFWAQVPPAEEPSPTVVAQILDDAL